MMVSLEEHLYRPPLVTGSSLQLTVPAVETFRTQTGVFTAVLHHTGGSILTGLLLRAHEQV